MSDREWTPKTRPAELGGNGGPAKASESSARCWELGVRVHKWLDFLEMGGDAFRAEATLRGPGGAFPPTAASRPLIVR